MELNSIGNPDLVEFFELSATGIDDTSERIYQNEFIALTDAQKDDVLTRLEKGNAPSPMWHNPYIFPPGLAFNQGIFPSLPNVPRGQILKLMRKLSQPGENLGQDVFALLSGMIRSGWGVNFNGGFPPLFEFIIRDPESGQVIYFSDPDHQISNSNMRPQQDEDPGHPGNKTANDVTIFPGSAARFEKEQELRDWLINGNLATKAIIDARDLLDDWN